ncbi:hypothetical protein CRM22_001945 [Opisthorchis felineus]|uniref:Uncharacterized protein n=2 Tax=Opisthorchis felineus TaxID=147828 RepID=A0A4S2M8M4_OPIFE|nr:hypothetical protein CRM22_001945 [Opisthorchis felineus]
MYGAPYPTGPAAAPYPTSPTMPGAGYSHAYPDPQSQSYGEYSASAGNTFTSSARFSDKSVRHAFIRKVYLILTAQLLVTCGIVSLFLLARPVKYWVQRNSWFYYISYATFLVTYITLVCCDNVRRRFPGNFIALSVFILHVVYGGLAALLFGLYLAFDTQMIMGGRKHELSPEEYIYGALQLYLDVVYLFMIILSLVGSKD